MSSDTRMQPHMAVPSRLPGGLYRRLSLLEWVTAHITVAAGDSLAPAHWFLTMWPQGLADVATQ